MPIRDTGLNRALALTDAAVAGLSPLRLPVVPWPRVPVTPPLPVRGDPPAGQGEERQQPAEGTGDGHEGLMSWIGIGASSS